MNGDLSSSLSLNLTKRWDEMQKVGGLLGDLTLHNVWKLRELSTWLLEGNVCNKLLSASAAVNSRLSISRLNISK